MLGVPRQVDGKQASFTQAALHRDLAAVGLGDVLDDGEPQAGAAERPAASLVNAVKTLEQARQVLLLDSDPVVLHAELDFIAGGP